MSAEEAMNCFAFGLSPDSRLGVTYRGPIPTKWVLEYKENEEWKMESVTALMLPPFWRRRVVYKQNHYLPEA